MEFEIFEKVINTIQNGAKAEDAVYEYGIDLNEVLEPHREAIMDLFANEYGVDNVNWITYYMWGLNFGEEPYDAVDRFGRAVEIHTLEDLWAFLEDSRDVTVKLGETYKARSNNLIAWGRHNGMTFYIMDRRAGPCAYINVTGTFLDGKTEHELADVECHGGVTWADNAVPGLESADDGLQWYIGWDYAHAGDWDKDIYTGGRKWSVAEIIEECHEVIDGLGK